MAEEIGVALNNEEELSKSNLGALTPEVLQALGILPKTYQSALLAAEALTPQKREVDPAMASFLFFNNMARAASQPGATVLGSAAQSFEDPAKYLMQINEANRASEQAKGPLAVNIAKSLKPSTSGATSTKTYKLNVDVPGVGSAGDEVTLAPVRAVQISNEFGPTSLKEVKTPLIGGGADEFTKKVSQQMGTQYTKFIANAPIAKSSLTTLDQVFNLLNSDNLTTNAIAPLVAPLKAFGSSLGILSDAETGAEVATLQAFESLVNKLALGTVKQLTGAISEKELKFLQSVQPQLSNSVEGNKLIVLLQKHQLSKAASMGDFWMNAGVPKDASDYVAKLNDWQASDIYKETPKDYVKRLAQEYEQQLRSGGMTDENQIANEIEERFSLSLFNEIYRSF
tara:strand:+ start:95 stop:1288 length:1194 start_codon:yes stop_codon:yes gene_type:complete